MCHFRDYVVADAYIFILAFNLYYKRIFSADDIVFGRILHEQLDGTWKHKPCLGIFWYIYHHLKPFREPHFEQVHILAGEFQLLPEGYKIFIFAFDHVSVYSSQFVDVGAGLFRLLFAYKAVQDVERVEKEMRVYLALEFEVSVLGEVGFLLLPLHSVLCCDGIVYHVNDAVDSYCCDERDCEYHCEVLFHFLIQAEWQFNGYDDAYQKGSKQHEYEQAQGPCPFAFSFQFLAYEPDVYDVYACKHDYTYGVREHLSCHFGG